MTQFNLNEFAAGKIAGLFLAADTDEKRQKLLREAPPKLLIRIKEIIEYYEQNETLALANKIAKLNTRAERNAELNTISPRIRERVKHTVISIFEQSKLEEHRGN